MPAKFIRSGSTFVSCPIGLVKRTLLSSGTVARSKPLQHCKKLAMFSAKSSNSIQFWGSIWLNDFELLHFGLTLLCQVPLPTLPHPRFGLQGGIHTGWDVHFHAVALVDLPNPHFCAPWQVRPESGRKWWKANRECPGGAEWNYNECDIQEYSIDTARTAEHANKKPNHLQPHFAVKCENGKGQNCRSI